MLWWREGQTASPWARTAPWWRWTARTPASPTSPRPTSSLPRPWPSWSPWSRTWPTTARRGRCTPSLGPATATTADLDLWQIPATVSSHIQVLLLDLHLLLLHCTRDIQSCLLLLSTLHLLLLLLTPPATRPQRHLLIVTEIWTIRCSVVQEDLQEHSCLTPPSTSLSRLRRLLLVNLEQTVKQVLKFLTSLGLSGKLSP